MVFPGSPGHTGYRLYSTYAYECTAVCIGQYSSMYMTVQNKLDERCLVERVFTITILIF